MVPVTFWLFLTALGAISSDVVIPKLPDLTVKTRTLTADHHTLVMTWYFKGARQRSEIQNVDARGSNISIYQCDKGLRYLFGENAKTYTILPVDPAEMRKRAKPLPPPEMSGAEVVVTIDSVDTGENRQLGSYDARRVKTTTIVEPGPGAVEKPSKTVVDGWYIDVPGRSCQNVSTSQLGWVHALSGRQDRIIFKRLGTAPHGLAVEETYTKTEAGKTLVNKTELVELSEEQLDDSLFEPPPDYSAAPSVADATKRR